MNPIVDTEVEKYAAQHSTEPPDVLNELEGETKRVMEMSQMLTGKLEGRFLKLLVQALSAKKVLEIGMFTGYGTLSMAEGLADGGMIYTCELDRERIQFATKFFAKSDYGKKIKVLEGPALPNIQELKPPFDLVFIDADKTNYPAYYEEALRLLRAGGFVAVDNALWRGQVLKPSDDDTKAIHELNTKIATDKRVEAVLLTVRDGIHLVRKK